jgi:hypothetical protein
MGGSYRSAMEDALSVRYGDLLAGSYDCVDRIVLNAYFAFGHTPGGFRTWWRRLRGSDDDLDNAHLMRMAGRFARRVRGWAKANNVPVIDCKSGERKHRIAEEYLATHDIGIGVFLVLVARAPAPVWKVTTSRSGVIVNLEKKREYVNHYSFHIRDPVWGHLTIKMSGHPPFGAQIMLNGHEYVDVAAQAAGIDFAKDGNCFSALTQPERLAQIADTVSQPGAAGLLRDVCERWIYSACVCFGLDVDEQTRTGFGYAYSVYQVEYSRNLLFADGARMQRLFDTVVDRTRSRLDVPMVRTLFGAKTRPHRNRKNGPPRLAAVIETPRYDLTTFKVHFGRLTLKAYTKGEHVLRIEAITHNTAELHCGRVLDRYGDIVVRLQAMAENFCTTLDCVDVSFVPDGLLDELPQPSTIGATRVGGIDLNRARMRTSIAAVIALAVAPAGFTVADLASKVSAITGTTNLSSRQAAYDLRKLRAKALVDKIPRSHRYHVPPDAARVLAGLIVLRDQVLAPILAGVRSPRPGRKPSAWTAVDRDYEQLRVAMQRLFDDLAIERDAA